MKSFVLIIKVSFIFILTVFASSCQKETDCIAIVNCQDSLGKAVGNANVYLYAKVKNSAGVTYTADITANSPTDEAGEVRFTFKLPAIYDIQATRIVGTKTITGIGIIKLEEGNTVEKTVTMK